MIVKRKQKKKKQTKRISNICMFFLQPNGQRTITCLGIQRRQNTEVTVLARRFSWKLLDSCGDFLTYKKDKHLKLKFSPKFVLICLIKLKFLTKKSSYKYQTELLYLHFIFSTCSTTLQFKNFQHLSYPILKI